MQDDNDGKPKPVFNVPDVVMGALILTMVLVFCWYVGV